MMRFVLSHKSILYDEVRFVTEMSEISHRLFHFIITQGLRTHTLIFLTYVLSVLFLPSTGDEQKPPIPRFTS